MFTVPNSLFTVPLFYHERKTILIADSCAGGFGALDALLPFVGEYNVIYLADSEYNPFGLKTIAQIQAIVASWFSFMLPGGTKPDVLVVACNTASLATRDTITHTAAHNGLQVVTMVDAFQTMLAANISKVKGKTVGIMATQFSIKSGAYQNLIKECGSRDDIVSIIATKCERAVANAYHTTPEGKLAIASELASYATSPIETIVLGCTCFKFIKNQIRSTISTIDEFLDPSDYLTPTILSKLEAKMGIKKEISEVIFLNTGDTEWQSKMSLLSNQLFGQPISVTTVTTSNRNI